MDEQALRTAVRDSLQTIAPEVDAQALQPQVPLRRQIDLDSVDWVNVLAAVEERLGVRLPPGALGARASIDDIVAALSRLTDAPSCAAEGRPGGGDLLPHESHVIDGVAVEVRPVTADDLAREAAFVRRLSPQSRYKRFMATVNELPEAKLKYLTDVDQQRHVALAAVVDDGGQPAFVGVARYVVDQTGTGCEFAVAVDDRWQGTGLAGILMRALIGVARARGLATMEGQVLAANTRMLKFTRQLGFRAQPDPEDRSTVRVLRSLQPAAPR